MRFACNISESPETEEELPSEPIKPVFAEQDLNQLVSKFTLEDAHIFFMDRLSLLNNNIVALLRSKNLCTKNFR